MKMPNSKSLYQLCVIIGATIALSACTLPWESYPPLPKRKASKEAQEELIKQQEAAQKAAQEKDPYSAPGGDWLEARDVFREELADARVNPDTQPEEIAVLAYEYGRTSGVLCDWRNAKSSLLEAYELDRSYDGPTHMALIELARVHLAQQQYAEARRYFEQALPELQSIDADKRDPLGYIDIVEEYSAVLSRLGESTLAQEWRDQASFVRDSAADKVSETVITPYGAYCQ